MTKTISSITATETYVVRLPVLREGKPIESCHFDGDNLPSTHHFGLFMDDSLIGVASIFKSKNKIFEQNNQIQLRGMAVLKSHQRQGLGEDLIHTVEDYAKKNKADIIWFNARSVAINFYKKLGYEIIGIPFYIKDIGTHYIMSKSFK